MTQTTILIADDDAAFARPLQLTLRELGHICEWAKDGQEAAAKVRGGQFDLVIADIHMPGNGSLELVRALTGQSPRVPVVLVTGYPAVNTAVEALRLGVVDYLSKPVEFERLIASVEDAIAHGQRVRQAEAAVSALGQLLRGDVGRGKDRPLAAVTDIALSRDESPPAAATKHPTPRNDEPDEWSTLSTREREVVAAFAASPNVKSVAKRLFISPHTVRNHLQAAYRKLGVRNQAALVAYVRSRSTPPADEAHLNG